MLTGRPAELTQLVGQRLHGEAKGQVREGPKIHVATRCHTLRQVVESAPMEQQYHAGGPSAPAVEPLLTFEQVCRILCRSAHGVRAMYRRGDFPQPIRVGRHPCWEPRIVRDWIEAQRAKAGGRAPEGRNGR